MELYAGGASASGSFKTVIAVHGMGDDPSNFKELFADLQRPTRVILPRAPRSYFRGFSWFDIRFPISDTAEELSAGIGIAAKRVAGLIAKLDKESKRATRPVICGFSQGGAISFAVAAKFPALISAAVPLSGAIPESLYPKKTDTPLPPLCAAHGDRDELIPIEGARGAVAAFVRAGGKADLFEIEGLGHSVDGRMQRFLWDRLVTCAETEHVEP